jgi:hypothetical protein
MSPTLQQARGRGRLPRIELVHAGTHDPSTACYRRPVNSPFPARILALALAGLAGCYTTTFAEDRPGVYYCVGKTDCLSGQACKQFRCVSDSGPQLKLTLPEAEHTYASTATELIVDFTPTDFVISDSNQRVEGEGKVRITIDGGEIEQTIATKGALVDISTLEPGPHHVEIQAVYGDGTPYPNPSSHDFTGFFIMSENEARPQIVLLHPAPGHVHVVGEPLEVSLAVRNFAFVEGGLDCKVPSDCDPFDTEDTECVPSCETPPNGHAHIYLIDRYPECLHDAPINCNGNYVATLRVTGKDAMTELDGSLFKTPGKLPLTVTLQYNDHEPYPSRTFVIYDTIEVHVVE